MNYQLFTERLQKLLSEASCIINIKMAASNKSKRDVARLPHHEQSELCTTRARYRQGKKFTAVKVYTINNESQHLLVCGVPSLGLQDELRHLCLRFGDVKSLVFVPNYAAEEFTDVFHLQYGRIQSARYAKRHLDGRSFFGGILHVCYIPEMESVEETRTKLIQRRKEVAARVKGDKASVLQVQKDGAGGEVNAPPKTYYRRKKHPALPVTADRLATLGASETGPGCIWKGIPVAIDPRAVTPAPRLSQVCGPCLPSEEWRRAGVRERRLLPHRPSSAKIPPPAPLASCSSTSASTNNTTLRFVPRPVTINKRIVFHSKRIEEDADLLTNKRKAEHLDGIGESMNSTVVSVRDKMSSVSVPSMEVVLERETAFKFGS